MVLMPFLHFQMPHLILCSIPPTSKLSTKSVNHPTEIYHHVWHDYMNRCVAEQSKPTLFWQSNDTPATNAAIQLESTPLSLNQLSHLTSLSLHHWRERESHRHMEDRHC
mmetsp:Transcript_20244/g.56408  ORF Transcript_20244/g.56408 Transcript_20244/m.56408 type:complete len:109 (+) Transcript_20244:843-1169(+)